jgi:hypothetical protein
MLWFGNCRKSKSIMITFDSEMDKLPTDRKAKIQLRTQELLRQANMICGLQEKSGWPHAESVHWLDKKD